MDGYKATFEQINISDRLPAWFFWSLVGLITFLLSEVIMLITGEYQYRIAQLAVSVLIAYIPSTIIWASRTFQQVMSYWSTYVDPIEENFKEWAKERHDLAFTLSSWQAKIVTLFITTLIVATFISVYPIYSNKLLNSVAYFKIALLAFVGAFSLYLIFSMLFTLREVLRFPVSVPFFLAPHQISLNLWSFYLNSTILVTFVIAVLSIGFWGSPFGLSIESLVWLVFLGSFPIAIFFWSFFAIHSLNLRIRNSQLFMVNREVQRLLELVQSIDLAEVDKLDSAMEIQAKVQSMRVWPIDWKSALTFIATLLLVIAQVAAAYSQMRAT